MGTISSNLDIVIFLTDGAKLMRPDFVSRVPKTDPSLHLSTYVDNRVGPSNMVTGVVPATTSPTPKLEWREGCFKKELAGLSQNFRVPFVDNVEVLYRLLWILAVVDS